MASIPLVSGGSQPVFAIDTRNGPAEALTAAYPEMTPTNLAGPALDFFKLDSMPSDIKDQCQVNGAVQQIIQAIQGKATVAFMQVNTGSMSIATYPIGAFGAVGAESTDAMEALVQSLGNIQVTNNGVTTGYDVSNAQALNIGFALRMSQG